MIRLFARHPVAANLTMILMIMAGIWAAKTMPTQLDPPVNIPLVTVEVSWRGASAEDLETLVTTPIEQQLRNLKDLKDLSSYTINGYTNIRAWFEHNADVSNALDQVKQRVASIRNLPVDIEPPVIRRAIDLEPIASVLISAPGNLADLVPLVRSMERELMARGVEAVEFDGLPAEEIAILVSGKRLQQMGMTLNEVAGAVAAVSQNVPAGNLGAGQGSVQLRSLDQRRDTDGFSQLTIGIGERLYQLGNLAEVIRRAQPGQAQLTKEGAATIEMMLWRDTNADAYANEMILQDWLAEVRPTLPPGVVIQQDFSVWQMLGAQLTMIMNNGLSGMVLVVGVLFMFLNSRAAWWVTIGIPVSFALAMALFYQIFGFGISIVALIGLIMALGIVVDDAIVVGEDIVTHYENGATPEEAAIRGSERMFLPVMTSSLTTLAAFLPLIIIGGVLGDSILALPTVLLCIIVASLVECFLVLPGHLRTSLANAKQPGPNSWRVRVQNRFFQFRDERFIPTVRLAFRYPVTTVVSAVSGVLLAVALIASQHVGFNLVTGFDFESLTANAEFAATTKPSERQQFVQHLETTLRELNEETGGSNVSGWTTKTNTARFNQQRVTGEQYQSMQASYAFEEQRTLDPETFQTMWRERITQPAFVERFTLGVNGGAGGGDPDITLVLRGEDVNSLKQGAEELAAVLETYPGVSNVIDNLPYGREQVIFRLLPRGQAIGLTSTQIGRQLRAAYSGERVQIFNEDTSEVEVRVMLPDAEREDIGQLRRFPIETPGGEFVALGNVAELYSRRGIDVIRHRNGQMAVAVNADVNTATNNTISIIKDIKEQVLPSILSKHNLQFDLGGRSRDDEQLLSVMAFGGMLTLILIYLILAWAFSSYLWPMAIMLAIPFGFTGAVFGHWIMGWDFGAMSLLAFFALTGIVVNDSIVLVTFVRDALEEGEALPQALEKAVRSRFRAVILTSLTTVAGLAPLLFAHSSLDLFFSPIAITLCFGLSFATLLVLIVIPTLLLLLENARTRVQQWRNKLTTSHNARPNRWPTTTPAAMEVSNDQ